MSLGAKLPLDQKANMRRGHAKTLAERFVSPAARRVKCANFSNRDVGQFAAGVLFTSLAKLLSATLSRHIGQIVGIGSHAQMRGVTAPSVVTRMHDHEPVRDSALREGVGDAVRQLLFVADGNLPVSVTVKALHPRPTIGRSAAPIHKRPESVSKFRGVSSWIGHVCSISGPEVLSTAEA